LNNRYLEIWVISHWLSFKPIPLESFGCCFLFGRTDRQTSCHGIAHAMHTVAR